MKKNEALTISIVSLVLSVIHLIASVIALSKLPPEVPMHFNIDWVCDGVGSPWSLLFLAVLPLIASIFTLCWLWFKKDSPHPKLIAMLMLLMTLYLASLLWMSYPSMQSGAKLGDQIDPHGFAGILPLLYSLMFIAIGNYLPIIQPNKWLGLRVSWTLENEQCWRVTHRFAGRLWVVTGIINCLIVLIAFLTHHAGDLWLLIVLGEMLAVDIIVPIIYAWKHKDEGKEQDNA